MLIAWMLGACVGKDEAETGEDTDDTDVPGWQTVGVNMPGAMLSVWGTSAEDVWTVGYDGGDGVNVRHYDGTAWTGEMLGDQTLWWVTGQGDDVWVCGEGGVVGRMDGELTVVDPTIKLFGVWAAAPDDVWTVGGNTDAASDAAAAFHYDGTTWTRMTLPAEAAINVALYKVWGSGPDDVWMVGMNGSIVHWDGAAFSYTQSPDNGHLFTVAGTTSDDVFAVGGTVSGLIIHWDGASWTPESPASGMQLNGVDASGVAVGVQGAVYLRGDQGWSPHPRGQATREDLHSVWVDPDGGVWAVGGHIASYPLLRGTLVYGGDDAISPM